MGGVQAGHAGRGSCVPPGPCPRALPQAEHERAAASDGGGERGCDGTRSAWAPEAVVGPATVEAMWASQHTTHAFSRAPRGELAQHVQRTKRRGRRGCPGLARSPGS